MSALARLFRLAPTAHRLYRGPLGDPAEQSQLEERFFHALRLPNGVFKSTALGRFDDVNEWLDPYLPTERPISIMDVAVSSGITSFDWLQHLKSRGVTAQMTASDLCLESWLVSLGLVRVLIDGTAYPLQYDLFGLGLRTASRNPIIDLPFSLLRLVVRGLLAVGSLGRELPPAAPNPFADVSPASTPWGLFRVAPIPLVSRSFLSGHAVLDQHERLELVEENLLDPTPEARRKRFHLLRAANILNHGYFDESTLTRLLIRLRERLLPGGRLLVLHSQGELGNHASLFERNSTGLELVARFGEGSNVESLASRLPTETAETAIADA